jgi:hypothetical protein
VQHRHEASAVHQCENDALKTLRNAKNIQSHHQYIANPENTHVKLPANTTIDYIYYTESDELVYFDNMDLMRGISLGSNETTMFLGRRREKFYRAEDPPELYAEGYFLGRIGCGSNLHELVWNDSTAIVNVRS